ncbi:hypothetical protein QBC34DRAFT_380159 [Podospora aff. communis PSN243]|uniref:Uncharacterized protein n=1 Tax=Podospora aff. communis PSN243 TaxID=3040156 RepID=A0AAV9GNB7_9PEZI|nr:hypothetical protein QBC34DRAFT_380159 [Podospora aff. communis PSN243]
MRFATIALALGTLCSGALAGNPCNVDNSYCGWYLIDSLGWDEAAVSRDIMYYCSGELTLTNPTVCGGGCAGPTAHCA